MKKLLTFLMAFAVPLAPAIAGDGAALRSLMTGDDSRGWEAVGKLSMAGRGFCTGALIADDLVLTAAHCLYDDSGALYPASEIEFLAGWRNGRAAAYRGARHALPHPSYSETGDDRSMDVALIELDQPIRNTQITPFATGDLALLSREVGVVSYAHDRAEMPALQDLCNVLGKSRGTLVLDCDVDYGSSGAPVFDLSQGEPRIVSVVSAKAMAGDKQVSLGTSLGAPLEELLALLEAEGDGVFTRVQPTVRVMDRDTAAAATGAKFVRP